MLENRYPANELEESLDKSAYHPEYQAWQFAEDIFSHLENQNEYDRKRALEATEKIIGVVREQHHLVVRDWEIGDIAYEVLEEQESNF